MPGYAQIGRIADLCNLLPPCGELQECKRVKTKMTTVYLNGNFIPLEQAQVPVLDRGFIFADGVYEVIPVFFRQTVQVEGTLRKIAQQPGCDLPATGLRRRKMAVVDGSASGAEPGHGRFIHLHTGYPGRGGEKSFLPIRVYPDCLHLLQTAAGDGRERRRRRGAARRYPLGILQHKSRGAVAERHVETIRPGQRRFHRGDFIPRRIHHRRRREQRLHRYRKYRQHPPQEQPAVVGGSPAT